MTVLINRAASQVIDPVILPYSEWSVRGDTFTVEPNTWTDPKRFAGINPKVFAILGCPNCKRAFALMYGVHKIDRFGKVDPDLQCGHKASGCSFHRLTYLDKWNKKTLYAIGVERFNRKQQKWIPEIHYCHATNQTEARTHLGFGNYRIVAIGPAIGLFVTDEKRGILTV